MFLLTLQELWPIRLNKLFIAAVAVCGLFVLFKGIVETYINSEKIFSEFMYVSAIHLKSTNFLLFIPIPEYSVNRTHP